jgi:signal transduction histidine kinase/CheY-like chemotaxis protein/AraC-like DNA-binding protein
MRLSNFPSFAVLSIFIDSLDNIWIGTQQNGLIFAEENKFFSNNFIKIKPEKLYDNSRRITEIKEDKYGNIWIGTYNGLYLVNKNKNLISHRNFSNFYLPEIINDFVIDEFMWLATANGVFKLDYQKNIDNSYKLSLVETLDLNNGLDNEFINSIVKVENNTSELGSYWFSSMIKVVNYNEKSGGLIEYGGMDGIDVQMFNLGASFQHNDDKIYFGASNDLIELDLKKISKDKNDGKVIFTHLKINQSKIYPNQEYNDRIVLNKNLSYLNEITLTDKERSFSVGFVNNDFNKRNKFAYKLIGYQDQWINLGHVKEIDFTGLSSSLFSDGKYKLIVASSLDNVNWENSSELLINIKPSPFLSFPALIIYILTLILLFYLIIRIYSNGLKLKSSLINSEKDKKREMDFAESKLGFFTNISHEFRTPLTLIISPIQEILNSTDLKANVSNKLTTVEKNANKLLNLINELLDFRKADHGLLKIKVAYGNFKNFSHEIFLLFNELAKSKNIEYEFICNEDEINLPFDRNKIEIVISNLISNALKFTPSGGKITVMVSSANGYCNCSVRDTGIGIPVKDVDKIFDEFYMVKSKLKNQTPGTGIGLFLSKKIIELHHGSINVLSDYGDGSEFIFSISMDANNYREVDLNFKKSEDLSVYHLENNTNSINNVSIESRETILVIDDNKDIRTYLNSLLSDNYEIIEAENGEVGLKLALSKIPDLIISDIMMPVMDGIELCSKLKKELSTSHIPIILLTARNSTLFEVSGFESGADDYITKPFKANILKARVTSLLDNRNNTRKHLLNKVRFEPVIDPNSNDDVEIGFIEKAIVLVEENIQNPNFGIDKMTDYFCMSQSTLYRKIKSLTGLSLTAFIRSVRLKKAAYLISTTDTKLTYVCYEVGFNDYKYFRTSFKQQFGCLPSKYKSSKVDTINQNI